MTADADESDATLDDAAVYESGRYVQSLGRLHLGVEALERYRSVRFVGGGRVRSLHVNAYTSASWAVPGRQVPPAAGLPARVRRGWG